MKRTQPDSGVTPSPRDLKSIKLDLDEAERKQKAAKEEVKALLKERDAHPVRVSKPFSKLDPATGNLLYWCRRCDSYYPPSSFAPSSIKKGVRRCSKCRSRSVAQLREQSPETLAAHCLYELERRRFHHRGGNFPIPLVKQVLERWGNRSVLSGRVDNLRLRRFWHDIPFNEWNSVVLTAGENKVIGHKKDWMTWFPEEVVEKMREDRQRYEETHGK